MSFNNDRRGGRGRDFGGRGFGGRGSSERPQMHQTTCSKCGKECEVPFRPTGAKPVFCSDCFREQGGNDRRSEGGQRSFNRRDDRRDDRPRNPDGFNMKAQLDELNAKLDKIMGMLASAPSPKEEATVVEEVVVKKPRAKKIAKETVEVPLTEDTEVAPESE